MLHREQTGQGNATLVLLAGGFKRWRDSMKQAHRAELYALLLATDLVTTYLNVVLLLILKMYEINTLLLLPLKIYLMILKHIKSLILLKIYKQL